MSLLPLIGNPPDLQRWKSILDPVITNSSNLINFGEWIQYSPTISSGTGTITASSVSASYVKFGPTIMFSMTISIGTNGSGATTVTATLPRPVSSLCLAYGRSALTGDMILGIAGNQGLLNITNYNNTYPGANGAVLYLSGFYQST